MSAWRRSTSSTKRLMERLWLSLSAMAAMVVTVAAAVMVVTVAAAAITAAGAMAVTVVTVAAAAEAAAERGGAAVGAAVAVAGAYAAAFGSCAFSIRALSRPPSMAYDAKTRAIIVLLNTSRWLRDLRMPLRRSGRKELARPVIAAMLHYVEQLLPTSIPTRWNGAFRPFLVGLQSFFVLSSVLIGAAHWKPCGFVYPIPPSAPFRRCMNPSTARDLAVPAALGKKNCDQEKAYQDRCPSPFFAIHHGAPALGPSPAWRAAANRRHPREFVSQLSSRTAPSTHRACTVLCRD